jgi:hypothetical protein
MGVVQLNGNALISDTPIFSDPQNTASPNALVNTGGEIASDHWTVGLGIKVHDENEESTILRAVKDGASPISKHLNVLLFWSCILLVQAVWP